MYQEEVDEELNEVLKQINSDILSISDSDKNCSFDEEPTHSKSRRLNFFKSLSENSSLLGSPQNQSPKCFLKYISLESYKQAGSKSSYKKKTY